MKQWKPWGVFLLFSFVLGSESVVAETPDLKPLDSKTVDCCSPKILSGQPMKEQSVQTMSQVAEAISTPPTEEWSASPEHIKKVPCRRPSPFLPEEMESWLSRKFPGSGKKVSQMVNGIELADEDPRLIALFEKLTTFRDDGMTFSSGREVAELEHPWNKECRKVLCGVKKLFGEKEGVQLLFMLGRFGYNGSHFVSKSKPWKSQELNQLLLSLSDYPDTVLPFEDNHPLRRYQPGAFTFLGGPTVVGNAHIELYPAWDSLPPEHRMSAVFHEVGHNLAAALSADQSPEWYALSGWKSESIEKNGKEETVFVSSRPERFVSKYATTNPSEDFAESVTAYRYNPQELKARSPEKYQFIKETVFDGLEYISQETCDLSHSVSRKIRQVAAEKNLKTAEFPREELEAVFSVCASKVLDFWSDSENADVGIQECSERAVVNRAVDRDFQESAFKYSSFARDALKLRNMPALEREQVRTLSEQVKAVFERQVSEVWSQLEKEMDPQKTRYYATLSLQEFCNEFRTSASLMLSKMPGIRINQWVGLTNHQEYSPRVTEFFFGGCMKVHAEQRTALNEEASRRWVKDHLWVR